ncbi:glycosyltransferase family 4 protein [Halorubrum ezzemoulense]|uniref:glycosyltransferase family 4 protein n=1 Tax=Halorubrum ezzemoulense TaxID=337243 RepID=UPI001C53026C|nr:glycosyltransferase family 4 protein [Halorubrum ezzemoulense]
MVESELKIMATFTDPRMGGPQQRSLDVARQLRHRDIETMFLIPFGDNTFANAAADAGFNVRQVTFSRLRPPENIQGNIRFFVDFIPTVRQISALIQENNIDAVHANMVVNFQTVLATARTNTPLAWHFNDTLTPSPVKQISAHMGRQWADRIVVAADAVHDYYFGSRTYSKTIYAPVDLNRFDPDQYDPDEISLRSELGLRQDGLIIGTVGNLNPIKGHKHLLRAIAKLVENNRDVIVPIIGAQLDSREQYFEELCDLRAEFDLEDTVEFVGFRSDIPELLSLFDVFVLPSIAEACPIVVLEAMAMECPVVATDVGGVPEEIPDSDHGWVVPPKDSDALARAIAEALDDPEECRRRAANARERVESMFSLEACVDRHEELYRSLVEET